ncbi:MAG: hypothetical protein L0221_18310 [Chloroflexi bacterium]|nr:hypothetical protein [Chloroflexota bacterium]
MTPFDLIERPKPQITFEGRPLLHPDEPVFDQGLQFDIETLLDRRKVLKLLGFGALSAGLTIVGCAPTGRRTRVHRRPRASRALRRSRRPSRVP